MTFWPPAWWPTCPAAAVEPEARVTCIRLRWHRGMHHSGVVRLPGAGEIELWWIRDWRRALRRVLSGIERWTTWPKIKPFDWGKR